MSEPLVEATVPPADYKKLERRARLKVDALIVPTCLVLYLFSFLDRVNIGQAKVSGKPEGVVDGKMQYADPGEGIMDTLHMTDHDYSIALTVLSVTYIFFKIPSNLVIRRIGAGLWIPLLVVAWGIVATLQGLVQSKYGLYIDRIFLGLTEAGILPGIAVYLTFFYKPRELQFRQAIFFTGASLSGAFSGLLATAIRKMDGMQGQEGWRWVFYLEGIATVLIGVACFFILPDNIQKCWFLSPLEKQVMAERLYESRVIQPHRVHKEGIDTTQDPLVQPSNFESKKLWRHELFRTYTDPAVWLLSCIGFCVSLAIYSIAYFSPVIVQEIGHYTPIRSMLMSCPPFAVAFGYSILIAFVSDHFGLRIVTALPGLLLSLVGYIVMYTSKESMTRYGGLIMATAGSYSVPPALLSWIANNSAGHYKRAAGIANILVFDSCGGLLSTWLFPRSEAKGGYKRGTLVNLALQAVGLIVLLVAEVYYLYERRMRHLGKRNDRVQQLQEKYAWSENEIRAYLGDRHPEYRLEV